MAGESDIKQLELRIKELEDQLKQLRATHEAVNISAEEVKAYRKVRDVLALDPDTECGINECSRCIINRCINRCIVNRCIVRCIFECTCGPCNLGDFTIGGGGRFGNLGD